MGRVLVTATLAVTLLAPLASCSSGKGGSARSSSATASGSATTVKARCSSAVATEPALPGVRTAMTDLPGNPDGVATSGDGRWSFASLQGAPGRIAVTADSSFAPKLVRTILLPAGAVSGLAVTHDRRLLIAAAEPGAVVVSVERATTGAPRPVLGELRAPDRGSTAGGGGAEVAVAADGRFAFVSLERAGAIAVFDLRAVAAGGFGRAGFVGAVRVGIAPIGLAVSPDNRWLYATSELARGSGSNGQGTLTVIDLKRAEADPASSVVTTAPAPCHPVRVAASPDGRVVWVTGRAGDVLLGFSVSKLLHQPHRALVAAVRVGAQPLGVVVVDRGRRVVVADSNLTGDRRATARLTVVDTVAALRGQPALLGAVRTGNEPSEIAIEPNGRTLLVNNSRSRQLEAVDLGAH